MKQTKADWSKDLETARQWVSMCIMTLWSALHGWPCPTGLGTGHNINKVDYQSSTEYKRQRIRKREIWLPKGQIAYQQHPTAGGHRSSTTVTFTCMFLPNSFITFWNHQCCLNAKNSAAFINHLCILCQSWVGLFVSGSVNGVDACGGLADLLWSAEETQLPFQAVKQSEVCLWNECDSQHQNA